ncbi:hypothetical protein PoB_000458400 [Plakobranchus ocellatus]|uniref:Uncharacterized protein n=1 Tax=Plakobranchus ocellatus TaxID=259542 RepID=A0AAV3Y739_9GAST|nr:hypothetical protein PoB_000458400 [Plakobranchus ocellatus]
MDMWVWFVVWFILCIASPQQGDFRLSGPPSGQGAGGGARTRDRRVPADLRADSLATVPPTPPMDMWMLIMYYFKPRRGHIFILQLQKLISFRPPCTPIGTLPCGPLTFPALRSLL